MQAIVHLDACSQVAVSAADGTGSGPGQQAPRAQLAASQDRSTTRPARLFGQGRDFPGGRGPDDVLAEQFGGWQQASFGWPREADLPHCPGVSDVAVADRPGGSFG